jgi:hypothetical protein
VFSSTLDSHLHQQDWSTLAQRLLDQRLARTQVPLEQYARVFDHAVVVNAKSLVLLMTLAFTCLLPLVFVRAKRPLMVHVVFSLHLYTFLLFLFCVDLLAAALGARLGLGGIADARVDNVLSLLNLAACARYLFFAQAPVYGGTRARRAIRALALALAAAAIVIGYRFVLFLITLQLT